MASITALLLEQCFNARDDFDLTIVLHDGDLPCHQHLILARCPAVDPTALHVPEGRAVVEDLLRWIYTGKLAFKPLNEENPEALGSSDRVVQLAALWGMRDLHAMRQRFLRSWRREPARGCVEEDLLKAYDEEKLGSTWFRCGEEEELVYAGFVPLLVKASSFFSAMFSSRWAEGADADAKSIKVGWDVSTLQRLMRFLHGGPSFIRDPQDLDQALHCADFFGMNVLVAHSNTWIVEHLDHDTAPRLWSYVESQPRLQHELQEPMFEDMLDADSECLDFHLREFPIMLEGILDGEPWVPLYDLTTSLMYRLVASGSLEVNTPLLKSVVANFVQMKLPQAEQKVITATRQVVVGAEGKTVTFIDRENCARGGSSRSVVRDIASKSKTQGAVGEYGVKQAPFDVNMPTDRKAMMQKLLPPEVLFNRELRDQVLGRCHRGVRDFV